MTIPEKTIFDLYEEEGKDQRKLDKKKRSKSAQAVREVGLGIVQGAGDVAQMGTMAQGIIQSPLSYGLLNAEQRQETMTPGQKARMQLETDPNISDIDFAALASDDDLMPSISLPGSRKSLSKGLEEIPEEGILQEVVRRGTRTVPMLLGGGALATENMYREMTGLAARKVGESLGLPEWANTVLDLAGSLTPYHDKTIKAGGKLIQMAERGKFTTEKQMVEGARKLGMSNEQIAPLLREGWFGDLLRKISPKRGGVQKALHKTKAGIGGAFETIMESDLAKQAINPKVKPSFVKNLESTLSDLSGGAKDAIERDLADLMKSDMTGRDLMVFWDKINDYWKQFPKLGRLKGPIKKALSSISPNLAADYEMANTLSVRFRDVASKLKPTIVSDIVGVGEVGSVFSALIHGGLPALMTAAPYTATIVGIRKLAQMMVTNPRFQNLHKKMITTINSGQVKSTKKILDQVISMVAKESPETAKELRKISIEDLKEMLKNADQ